MNYWHMQMFPGNAPELDKNVPWIIQNRKFIGLGDWDEKRNQIGDFCERMQVNDIVAIKNGAEFIALVQIIGGVYSIIVESLIKSNKSKEPKQQGIHISQPPLFPQPLDPCPCLLYRVEIRAIGRKPQYRMSLSLQRIQRVLPFVEGGVLSITITLHAGSSGSSISVTHVWKTSLSMLQSKAVKANGTVPHRAPITLVCALLHPDTPAHFCPRGA